MPNNWYHETKYNNVTWSPKKLKKKAIESVKRKAIVGDSILITNAHYASDFSNGSVFTVTEIEENAVSVKEERQGIYDFEYEVITKSEEVYE